MRVRRRGIVLIGILVLTLLATFFLGALLQLNPTRLRRSVQDERHDHAIAAARAGVEYALARLVDDQEWNAHANTITVDSEHLVVREDHGNVLGWLRAEDGSWSGFRLRFNFQDGSGGSDGFEQPSQLIPTEAISYNNLRGRSAVAIPRGTGSNFAYTGSTGFSVPEHTVALLVEGYVAPDVTPHRDAGPSFDAARGDIVMRRVEGIYQIVGFSGGHPDGAVLQAGGDSRFLLGSGPETPADDNDFRGYLRLSAPAQTAVMRTKGASTIDTAPGKSSLFNFYPDMHSVVRSGKPTFSPRTKVGQEFRKVEEPAEAVLMDIAWNKVATSEQEDRLRLPAGVYAVAGGDTDSSSDDRVKYFPVSFPEYRRSLVRGEEPPTAPVPPEFLKRVSLNGSDWTTPDGNVEKRDLITFEKDVEVTEVDGQSDFAIVPLGGARQKSSLDQAVGPTPSEFASMAPEVRTQVGEAVRTFLSNGVATPFTDFNSTSLGVNSTLSLATNVVTGLPVTVAPGVDLSELPGTEVVGLNRFVVTDLGRFLAAVEDNGHAMPAGMLERDVDPLEVPADLVADGTQPQDIVLRFAPTGGQSAAIRSEGNVFLATHLTGTGGAVVAGGRIDAVGLGVDLEAGLGERDGVSFYSKKGINISTYDQKRNKFWDAAIKGVVFTNGDLSVRLGETVSGGSPGPGWGKFDFQGAIVALGKARAEIWGDTSSQDQSQYQNQSNIPAGDENEGAPLAMEVPGGNVAMVAGGIRLFYQPKFMAPFVEETVTRPIFAPVSVLER